MQTREAGLKAIWRRTVSGSWTLVSDTVKPDSADLTPTAIKTETANSSYQSGSIANPKFHVLDHADYNTLEGAALGPSRTKYFFGMEFYDGNKFETSEAVFPMVTKAHSANRRDPDQHYVLELELADRKPWTEKTTPFA